MTTMWHDIAELSPVAFGVSLPIGGVLSGSRVRQLRNSEEFVGIGSGLAPMHLLQRRCATRRVVRKDLP
jgi:hypothetical protein